MEARAKKICGDLMGSMKEPNKFYNYETEKNHS